MKGFIHFQPAQINISIQPKTKSCIISAAPLKKHFDEEAKRLIGSVMFHYTELCLNGYLRFFCPITNEFELTLFKGLLALKGLYPQSLIYPLLFGGKFDAKIKHLFEEAEVEPIYLSDNTLFCSNTCLFDDFGIDAILTYPGDDKSTSYRITQLAREMGWQELSS